MGLRPPKSFPVKCFVNRSNKSFEINTNIDNRYYLRVDVLGLMVSGLLDSGASVTVFGNGYEKYLTHLKINKSPIEFVKTAGGEPHPVIGSVLVPFKLENETHLIETLVIPSIKSELVLGVDFWRKFKIRPQIFVDSLIHDSVINPIEHNLSPEEQLILVETANLFQTKQPGYLSKTKLMEYEIDTGITQPIKQRHHLWSPYVNKEVVKEVERMLELGVVEPSISSWNNPVVIVPKESGAMRLCLDSRALNKVTKKDAYPLPKINSILHRFHRTKFLSKIDLTDAFWQIPLSHSSREKTAFTIPGFGLLQFKRLPFGLTNAAQALVRLLDKVLGVDLLPHVFVYLDDVIVASEDFEHHISLLKIVASRFKAAGLTINIKKSKFCLKEISYLGFLVNENGFRIDDARIAPIVNYPVPTTIKRTRRFLGMTEWYSRFIKGYSEIAAPIFEVIRNPKKKFMWTECANKSFEILKNALISAPILGNPDFDLPFYLQCDASDFAVGSVLFQKRLDGSEVVISYFSKKMTDAQKKYTVTEKEALAVLLSVEKFRCFIEGTHFYVISDHASLQWLFNLKNPSGRLARWVLRMQQFDFDINHRPGSQNVVPDALSRDIASISIDSDASRLMMNVRKNPGNFPDFKIEDGFLYKHILDQGPIGDYRYGWRLYVSRDKISSVLSENHDKVFAGHFGFFKTLSKIREKYYWPGMFSEIKNYVKNCEVCKAVKDSNQQTRAPMGAPKKAKRPWQLISTDFLGPFVRSKSGNTMLLVVIDWFSKFILLQPMRKATSKSTIKFLENNVFCVFGSPERLVSDNGSQFRSHEFKSFLEGYSVKHWLNASYHAQTNPAERSNKVILSTVRAFLDDTHKDWDLNIAKIGCAINSAVHESTKFSPYSINFGYSMIMSGTEHTNLDKILENIPHNLAPNNINDFVVDKNGTLHEMRLKAEENIRNAFSKYAKYYNLRARAREYKKGDIVWKKNFSLSDATKGISAKLNDRRIKCIVRKKVGYNTYELEDEKGKRLGIFHLKDLS